MLRGLIHHWRMNLAVVAGAAVAAAVLTGALLVGDSVRGSLRELSLERLGGIDHALAGQRFLPAATVEELAADPEVRAGFSGLAPAILLRGSATHGESRRRASGVGVHGVEASFFDLFPGSADVAATLFGSAEEGSPRLFPAVVLNQALARELGAEPGDRITLALERWSEVPRGSLLGRKGVGDVVQTIPLEVAAVVPDRGVGRFGLEVHQAQRLNAFLRLEDLARALGEVGLVNSVLARQTDPALAPEAAAAALDAALARRLTPETVGLTLEPHADPEGEYLILESREFILGPELSSATLELAERSGAWALPIYTYLVNRFRLGEKEATYATVAAMATTPEPAFGSLRLRDGSPAPDLGEGEILLGAWLADELDAEPGQEVEISYFVVGPREDLREESATFTVAGVLAMEGLAVDASLSQEYPGIGDAADMRDWDPPFPIDLSRVTAADEDYWDLYRGTPKAFVAEAAGRRLWGNRWGDLTSIRLAPPPGEAMAGFLPRMREGLLAATAPEALGLAFQPVKARSLEASSGATDFGGLFLGFSMFLIASAALVAALLFRLGVEQRANEVGLSLAVGFPRRTVRRRLLAEGAVLAVLGGLLGLAGAVAYAATMMAALRTWWLPAVGTSALYLHVAPATLAAGFAASVAVVLASIWWTVRRVAKVPVPTLLARSVAEPAATRAGRKARWGAFVCLGLAGALFAYALASGKTTDPGLFFALGPLLLLGLLALYALWLGRPRQGALVHGRAGLARVAAEGGSRNRGRSLLASTLVACASFLIVTVAAFEHDYSREELGKDSGSGGFALVAESEVPLLHDLESEDGRFELGLPNTAEERLAGASFYPFRLLPGDDTSCLNLYQPSEPRLLGVPPEFVARGGFDFQRTLTEAENPWTLLEQDLGEGVVPAIGDANSTQWILKLGLGEELEITDGFGEPLRLRLVGMLATSIFQSELLISEAQFRRHFPDREGFSYFLADFLAEAPAGEPSELAQALELYLEPYGVDAMPAGEKLAAFHAVQNTFLSTFRTLGGLGLLLGTVGLAIILVRNLLERQGELATLRAFGFRRRTLTWMAILENALLLAAGLAIGTLAALATVTPHLLKDGASVPWATLAWTLAAIFLFGLAACSLAASGTLRISLLPALKARG